MKFHENRTIFGISGINGLISLLIVLNLNQFVNLRDLQFSLPPNWDMELSLMSI